MIHICLHHHLLVSILGTPQLEVLEDVLNLQLILVLSFQYPNPIVETPFNYGIPHFFKRKQIITAGKMFRFSYETQTIGESINEYLAQIRSFTEYCNFPVLNDLLMTDWFKD